MFRGKVDEEAPMTPEEPEQSRRIADELARRERRARQPEPVLDPTTLAAILEKHEAAIAQIVARAETALADRIDALANAQGAAAESVRREIERGRRGAGEADDAAALKRFRDEQRAAWKDLSAGVRGGLDGLTRALDKREGTLFDRIDRVGETVAPVAEALSDLRQGVADTAAVARDVADIKDAAVGSRRALDEVANIRQIEADKRKAIDDMLTLRPVMIEVARKYGAWNATSQGWLWFGLAVFVVVALAFSAGGVALQRETGIWPPLPEAENRERDAFWERHGEQVTHCIEVARAHDRGMSCTIVDMDP